MSIKTGQFILLTVLSQRGENVVNHANPQDKRYHGRDLKRVLPEYESLTFTAVVTGLHAVMLLARFRCGECFCVQ